MRPKSVTVIAIVNSFGALLTVVFWGMVLVRIFAPESPPPGLDRASLSTTFGFMVSDLAWATALLAVSAIGLVMLRAWGWLAAQMVNILWLYSMTVIWCRDLYSSSISPGAVIFMPFVPFSAWAVIALWKQRQVFGIRDRRGE
ncbi:MAG: hypothetical protein GF417_02210 [Candidatus Latescibacteria bacterium]|nr:hypothetical protein [bacterium]MBD3423243.1 hypothetical protein [Candidatus Latescibacterota bacterium]